MSERPTQRLQFTLVALFVVVTEACMGLAGLQLLNPDERVSLLIVMAVLGTGYVLAVLMGLFWQTFRKSAE